MKQLRSWRLLSPIPLVFAASLFLGWCETRVFRAELAPGGRDSFLSLPILTDMALGLVCFLAVIVGPILCCWRRMRIAGIILLLGGLSYMGGCNLRPALFGVPQREVYTHLGERMMPLVQAIEAYHRDHAAYPENVDILVPTYLDKIPAINVGNHTNLNYLTGPAAQTYAGNPWLIDIDASHGPGFDQFYYFPLQNYPRHYERMGKWAYFHE